jgi:predicted nucleotidyltransferase component of viral defense system
MIRKQDILDRAAEWQLRPEVVEKDYVLGWLLAALAQLPEGTQWVFKGGTCIKKCYFETYRFSEDLDFSLRADATYTQEGLVNNLRMLTARAAELSGVTFPAELVEVRVRQNLQGQQTFEGKIAYRGPLAFPGTPKILFDFTQHEPILDSPSTRAVLHPYPDDLPDGAVVNAYSFNELLAEKTRALRERSRPRDLYDVVHLLENAPGEFDFVGVHALFVQKCAHKRLGPTSRAELVATVAGNPELRSEWSNMLAHQLPALPDLDGMLGQLPGLLEWLDVPGAAVAAVRLPPPPIPARNMPLVSPGIRYWGSGLPLETVRFAGTNRLLVEFIYHGKHRLVEPYSIRRAESTGNLLLYAWELDAGHIKAYKVDEMQNVHSTGRSFTPRYQVELSALGSLNVRPTTSRGSVFAPTPQSRAAHGGPTYVFECAYCQKRFSHSTNDTSIRKHKRKDGWGDCPGRRGHLVEIR